MIIRQFWIKHDKLTHCVAGEGVEDNLLVSLVDCLILTAAEAEVFDGIFFVFLFDSCGMNYVIILGQRCKLLR